MNVFCPMEPDHPPSAPNPGDSLVPVTSTPPVIKPASLPVHVGTVANTGPDRNSKGRLALALMVAAGSDVVSIWMTFMPPIQFGIDIITALLLFMILGWRWMMLPAFIAEAIPGLGVFPIWVLVVASIGAWGAIHKPGLSNPDHAVK